MSGQSQASRRVTVRASIVVSAKKAQGQKARQQGHKPIFRRDHDETLRVAKRCRLPVVALAAMASSARAQGAPIKIGFGMALTGGLAGGGKAALLSYQIWAEEVNARGGLLGRKVELVHYDDQSNPATVPGIYSKLIDIDKVDIVISVTRPCRPRLRCPL